MNIIVLAGGLSPERNVSLSSGSLISSALRRKGHKILMLDVYEGLSDEKIPSNPLELFTEVDSAPLSVGNIAPTPKELEDIKKKTEEARSYMPVYTDDELEELEDEYEEDNYYDDVDYDEYDKYYDED